MLESGRFRIPLAGRCGNGGAVFPAGGALRATQHNVFCDEMGAEAAIERMVIHSVILELTVPSYRVEAVRARTKDEEMREESNEGRQAGAAILVVAIGQKICRRSHFTPNNVG